MGHVFAGGRRSISLLCSSTVGGNNNDDNDNSNGGKDDDVVGYRWDGASLSENGSIPCYIFFRMPLPF